MCCRLAQWPPWWQSSHSAATALLPGCSPHVCTRRLRIAYPRVGLVSLFGGRVPQHFREGLGGVWELDARVPFLDLHVREPVVFDRGNVLKTRIVAEEILDFFVPAPVTGKVADNDHIGVTLDQGFRPHLGVTVPGEGA